VPTFHTVLAHPHAMLPRVIVSLKATPSAAPISLAVRPEFLADFMARHGLTGSPIGAPCARYRIIDVSAENGALFQAVERLGYRGFIISESRPGFADAVLKVRELWRARKRDFANDDDGEKHAFDVLQQCVGLVGVDVACELYFAEERYFWELRNRAGRVQKRRQDLLGLGWANHDHHTFRCSRRHFPGLVKFMEQLGLSKRERFYAGAEAGWGAQVMETPSVGIVVFADVDLLPDEVDEDYAAKRLPEVAKVGTVGLWCGLHGDSFLQSGMHHLEARFNHPLLKEQLAADPKQLSRGAADRELGLRVEDLVSHVSLDQAGRPRLELPPGLRQAYDTAAQQSVFAILDKDGQLVEASTPELGAMIARSPPADSEPSYFQLSHFGPLGQNYSGVGTRLDSAAGPLSVIVAQVSGGDQLVHSILREFVFDIAWYVLPFVALALLLAAYSVRRSLLPLRGCRLRRAPSGRDRSRRGYPRPTADRGAPARHRRQSCARPSTLALPLDLHVGEECDQRMDAHLHQGLCVEPEQSSTLRRRQPKMAGIRSGVREIFAAGRFVVRQSV